MLHATKHLVINHITPPILSVYISPCASIFSRRRLSSKFANLDKSGPGYRMIQVDHLVTLELATLIIAAIVVIRSRHPRFCAAFVVDDTVLKVLVGCGRPELGVDQDGVLERIIDFGVEVDLG